MTENNDGKKRNKGTSRAKDANKPAPQEPARAAATPEAGAPDPSKPAAQAAPTTAKPDAKPADAPKSDTPSGGTAQKPAAGAPPGRKPPSGETRHGGGAGGGGAATILAVIALLLALALAAGGFWWWQTDTERAAEQQDRLASLENRLADLQTSIQNLQGAWQPALNDVQSRLSALSQDQTALRDTLQAVRAELGREADDWVYEEVEYLIRVANRRLQLARDVDSAIAALQAADQRLSELATPAVLPVRRALTEAMLALEAVPQPDVDGIATVLAGLADRTDTLALAERFRAPERPPLPEEGGPEATEALEDWDWRAFGERVWRDLKSLVVVRRNETAVAPMLAPTQQYFLHQNLRLKLEEARLALLRRNQEVFRGSLEQAQEWLRTYFATDSAGVQSMLQRLEDLQNTAIAPPLPDISEPLRVLHRVMEQRPAVPNPDDASPEPASEAQPAGGAQS